MAGKNVPTWVLRGVRFLIIPLIVVFLLACFPGILRWLTGSFQTHPLWAAFVLGMLCFAGGFLVVGWRPRIPSRMDSDFRDVGVTLLILIVVLGLGMMLVGASEVFAVAELKAAAFRAGTLWAFAYFMVGFLVGFLFGIPRVLQETNAPGAPPTGQGIYVQRVNTNLEQISDWLTKIIVGIGLVELKRVPEHLSGAARWVAESLSTAAPPSPVTVSFAGSLIIFFSIVGFLGGYLLTRLYLAGAFGRADRSSSVQESAFTDDNFSDRIRKFWRPPDGNGAVNSANAKWLQQWMNEHGLENKLIGELINTKELEDVRKKVVDDLPSK